MQVNEVKKQIQSKRFSDRFFVFTGEEIEAQRIYVNKISEVTGKPVKRIEQVSEAFNKRASLLKVSYVFVCRDDMDFWKSATPCEVVTELLGDNILILQMTDIDKRSKSSKVYAEQTVEFNHMDADVLYKYVQKECHLTDNNSYSLIDMCERDYSRVLLETDKIRRYARACDISEDEAYEKLVSEGTITKPPQDAIFDFVNAFMRADIGEAFRLLEECKRIGESPLKIISVMYTNVRRVLQVQICPTNDIEGTTGLSPWEVRIAKQTLWAWQSEDLVFFLKALQSMEQKIKTGEVDEATALDYLMVSIL